MKRCPQCSRIYSDETLNFCLDDGQWLLEISDSLEPPTAILSGDDPVSEAPTRRQLTESTLSEPDRITTSAEYFFIKRHKIGVGIIVAVLVVGLAAAALWIYKLASADKPLPPSAIRFVRLTSGGKIGNEEITGGASISPDGKYVVFWTQEQDKNYCYVRQVSTNSLVRIVGPTDIEGGGTTFSPDGEFVYFNENDKNNPDGALFKVPVLGGPPQKILEGIWSPVSFSPDGKQIAYVRLFPSTGESWLVVANADGSGSPQTISKRSLPNYYSKEGPSWSPDGKKIVVGADAIPGIFNATLVEVPAAGGSEHIITPPQWSEVSRVAWVKDGSGLVLTAFSSFISTGTQLWYVSYPEGNPRRITNDLNGYGTLSLGLTADSETIVTVQEDYTRNVWAASPNQDPSQARQLSSGKLEGISLAAAPDGRIVYIDQSVEGTEIWIMKGDGTEKKQLTTDGAIKPRASVTPDGRYILFSSNRSGGFNIWRMDLDGNNQKQLTNNETFAYGAVASNDGKSVIYQSLKDGNWNLWKVPIDGGDSAKLTERPCALPRVSPDGKSIACVSPDENAGFKWRIAVIPFEGGAPNKLVDLPDGFNFDSGLAWSPDGRFLAYVDGAGSASNIFSQPIDGGPRKPLTTFKTDRISSFAFTRDGKQLILGRGPSTDDVVLIKDFR